MDAVNIAALLSILLALGASASPTPVVVPPRLAPAQYATENSGLRFRVPKGSTDCPLPKDWVGSDHGTTVFLEGPRRCGGAGYPSSSRAFEPEDVARLDLFYAYWMAEDEPHDDPCQKVGSMIFLGARRAICEERKEGFIIRSVKARYFADEEAQAILSLITRTERLQKDMETFKTTAASFRTCKSIWHGPKGRFTIGRGALCPRRSRWF